MLFGAVVGILHTCFEFTNSSINYGPVQNSTLTLCGTKIHRCFIAAPCCIVGLVVSILVPSVAYFGCFDLTSFCFVLTVNDLVFPKKEKINSRLPVPEPEPTLEIEAKA